MAVQLIIGGTDFTSYIATDGFEWEHNDIDSANSGRDMNGKMRRKVIARKYKLAITCRKLTSAQQSRILSAIGHETVQVTFFSPKTNSTYSGEFYNSKRSGGIEQDVGGETLHKGTSFDLIEV